MACEESSIHTVISPILPYVFFTYSLSTGRKKGARPSMFDS